MPRKASAETQLRKIKRELNATRARMQAMERRINWGRQMANLCFNLSQADSIPTQYRDSMKVCCDGWDNA